MNQMPVLREGGCYYDHEQIHELIQATRDNGAKLDNLGVQVQKLSSDSSYNELIKWTIKALIGVICIIALGNKAIEVIESVWGRQPRSATEAKQ